MITAHIWERTSDEHWYHDRCTTCPNHGPISFRKRNPDMNAQTETKIPAPRGGDDHKVSTCPKCGNYNCICVR